MRQKCLKKQKARWKIVLVANFKKTENQNRNTKFNIMKEII